MSVYRFLISGGGSGGHIFPAVAIANELRKRFPNCEIKFVGAKGRMEMTKVPDAGYEIEGLWISGLQRNCMLKNFMFPCKVLSSLLKSNSIIRKFKPDYVIGTGGYASGPTLRMAQLKGIPTLIQEQNSYPGITNKVLSPRVKHICVAYPQMNNFFPEEKITRTGNPIRDEMLEMEGKREKAAKIFKLKKGKPCLLLVGGSQGALSINRAIAANIKFFGALDLQFIWQTGTSFYREALNLTQEYPNIQVVEFIKQMDLAYAASDIIISRAGAIAISEICAVSKPVIFIPLPSAAEDHQTKNAQALVMQEAAIMVKDKNAKEELPSVVENLLVDKEKQERLIENIKKLAVYNSAEQIVELIAKDLGTE